MALITNTIKLMTGLYSKEGQILIHKAADVSLIFAVGIYILVIDIGRTTMKLGLGTHRIVSIVIVALSVLTVVRLGCLLTDPGNERKPFLRSVACALAVDAVFFCVWHENPSNMLLVLMVLTLGTVAMDHRKILKVYIITAAAVIFTAIAMEWIGAIDNYVYIRDMTIRSSWGIKYPTDMMSLLFFLLLTVWVVYGNRGGLWYVIPGAVLMIMSHYVADSRTGVICGALFVATVIAWRALSRKEANKFARLAGICCCGAFPFFTIIMNGLMLAYKHGSTWAYRINEIMSNRLYLSVQALNEYGVSLWGKPLEQVGWGGSVFAKPGYNFVDISYVLLLLKYGVVALIVINILWVLMTRHAFRVGDTRLALALTLITFNCAIEHHILQLNYDIFIAIPFAVLTSKGVEASDALKKKAATEDGIRNNVEKLIIGALLAAVASFCVLALLPKARTVITLIHTDNSSEGRRLLAVVIAASLIIAAKGIESAYRLILGLVNKNSDGRKKDIILVGALVVMLCLAAGVSSLVIERGVSKKDSLLESERSVIELIQANKSGKLYVKGIPAIYQKKYGGISNSLFNGEELARYRDTSVIMEADLDSPIFFNTGFLYVPISEKHALFTNDEPVIRALQKEGYHLTAYFPLEKTVNLKKLAKRNGIEPDSDGTITLRGADEALENGPRTDLRAGRYTITFDLAIDPSSSGDGEEEICRLVTTYYKGEYELSDVPITRDVFDADGNCITEVIVEMPDAEDTDFCVYPTGQNTVRVKGISYQKTPKCDTHSIYNEDRVKIREEYYDLDGKPCTLPPGQSAAEFKYDEKGNQTEVRYYDVNDKATLVGGETWGGYYGLTREFDDNGRITREDFFGLSEEPVMLREGYASKELLYEEESREIVGYKYYDTNGVEVQL